MKSIKELIEEFAWECDMYDLITENGKTRYIASDNFKLKLTALIEGLLPTEEIIKKRQKDRGDYIRQLGYSPREIAKYKDAIKETVDWLRSRLLDALK